MRVLYIALALVLCTMVPASCMQILKLSHFTCR